MKIAISPITNRITMSSTYGRNRLKSCVWTIAIVNESSNSIMLTEIVIVTIFSGILFIAIPPLFKAISVFPKES